MFNLNLKYENLDDSGDEDPFARAKMATCKWAADLLQRYYPGHPWMVEVRMNRWGGVIQIQIRGLMPSNHWYSIPLSRCISDPGGKTTVRKAAGELLERYGIARTGFTVDQWQQALNRFPINGRGHLEPLR
jgi:hypothetical protein